MWEVGVRIFMVMFSLMLIWACLMLGMGGLGLRLLRREGRRRRDEYWMWMVNTFCLVKLRIRGFVVMI